MACPESTVYWGPAGLTLLVVNSEVQLVSARLIG